MLKQSNITELKRKTVFRIDSSRELRQAGPDDLIRLMPAPGCHSLILPKYILEILVYTITGYELCHLSGPSGSAKSSLLEAFSQEAANFRYLCEAMDRPYRPLRLFPVEMAIFESPGELFQRRSLKDGSTYDEKSLLVKALEKASQAGDSAYPLIWLREIGRVHSAMVQGGLLNLMTRSDVALPDGQRLDVRKVAWVADSNYQAEGDSTHTLVTLDDALKRRFTVHLTMDYLTAEQEVQVLQHLSKENWR